jgi:hypothetical protein
VFIDHDVNEEIQIALAGTISSLNDATSLDFDDLFVTLRRTFFCSRNVSDSMAGRRDESFAKPAVSAI